MKKPKPSLLRRFRKAISFPSHLSVYLPLMSENKMDRIKRLINDKSVAQKNDLQKQKAKGKSLRQRLNIRIYSPTSKRMLVWFIFVFMAILYYYIQMGVVLTFGQQVWEDELTNWGWILTDFLSGVIFFIDILVNFHCGFLYRGMIIMDENRIAARYFAYQFFLDAISLLIIIICPATGIFALNYAKLWLILKLIRLSQIDDFYLRKLNINRVGKAFYVIFKMTVIIFLLSHAISLIFYAMDHYYLFNQIYPPSFCWLISSTAYSPIISLDYSLQYLYTLYWGVNTITTISYGDIAPLNPPETNYAIVCFCFGFIVYGYVVNQIVRIILWARENEDIFQNQMILMQAYMEKMKISKDLRQDVIDYLQFLHREEKDRNIQLETSMRNKIPEHLRIELLRSAYSIFYNKMLEIFSTPEIIRVFFHLSQKKYTHDETVFEQGSRASRIVYLSKGSIVLKLRSGNKIFTIYTTQSQNQMVGHYHVLSNQKWPFNALTQQSSIIYSIERLNIMNEINVNSELREKIKLIEYELIHRNNYSLIYHFCYFCNQNHNFNECPSKFPYFNPKFQMIKTDARPNQSFKVRQKKNNFKELKKLDTLYELHSNKNFRLIMKIQKRLSKIKNKIEKQKRNFQIDTAFDWKIYEPQWNLSVLKQKWNESSEQKLKGLKNVQ